MPQPDTVEVIHDGCTLGVRLSRLGMLPPSPLLAARPQAITPLAALVDGFTGLVPAEKGGIAAQKQTLLAERDGLQVVTPPRARMPTEHPRAL